MKYSIMAYYDIETEKFNPCMLFPFAAADAIESIKEGVIKGKIEGAEAFELYHLGSYDTANASFELLDRPAKVLKLADYVRKQSNA